MYEIYEIQLFSMHKNSFNVKIKTFRKKYVYFLCQQKEYC